MCKRIPLQARFLGFYNEKKIKKKKIIFLVHQSIEEFARKRSDSIFLMARKIPMLPVGGGLNFPRSSNVNFCYHQEKLILFFPIPTKNFKFSPIKVLQIPPTKATSPIYQTCNLGEDNKRKWQMRKPGPCKVTDRWCLTEVRAEERVEQ